MSLKKNVFRPSLIITLFLGLFYSGVSSGDPLTEFSGYELHKRQCDGLKKLMEEDEMFTMPLIDKCIQIAHNCHVSSTEKGGSFFRNSGLSSECITVKVRSKPEQKTEQELQIEKRVNAYRNAKAEIYFIPIGDVSDRFMLDLADYYSDALNIPIAITPSIKLANHAFNKKRDQYGASTLIADAYERFEDYSLNQKATYIGITHADLYFEENDSWRFTFGSGATYDSGTRKGAGDGLISSARMASGSLDERNKLIKSSPNLRKMVSRYIGELHYKKDPNDNPESVLYHSISELDDLDTIKEDSIYADVLGINKPKQ